MTRRAAAARWLDDLSRRAERPGPYTLDLVREVLARLGNPERRVRCLHVAGTRGKGSTCALLSAGLAEAGYRVGLATSPHLLEPTERIRFGGVPVAAEELLDLAADVQAAGSGLEPSYFETLTAASFLAFARHEVDVAVVEVGLGGRLDATNVIVPVVAGITRLGLDHADRLGSTRQAVAREKAGILKPGVPAVLAPNAPEAVEEVSRRAREVGAPLLVLGPRDLEAAPRTALPGEVQRTNAAVAWAMLAELEAATAGVLVVPRDVAERAFLRARWPARLELISGVAAAGEEERVDVLLDVAHDVDSVDALAAHVGVLGRPVVAFVFTCLAGKDVEGIARTIALGGPLRSALAVVPELLGPRARPAAEVVAALRAVGLEALAAPDVGAALAQAASRAARRARPGDRALVPVFGSFHVAEAFIRAARPPGWTA